MIKVPLQIIIILIQLLITLNLLIIVLGVDGNNGINLNSANPRFIHLILLTTDITLGDKI